MDSLIFELQIVFYFQLFLSANVRHTRATKEIGDVFTQAILSSYCLSFIVCNHALNSRGHFVHNRSV